LWGDHKTRAILSDFPWLWAVRSEWYPALTGQIKVSQNMADLKAFLQQKSSAADGAEVWIVTQYENPINKKVSRIDPLEGETWAERVDHFRFADWIGLLYVILYRSSRFVIFRDPKSDIMDEHIRSVLHLTGKCASAT
jgi:hypothetical protein